jgi:hypothetical protein
MPEFRDINIKGIEISTYPVNKCRRLLKNVIPYWIGNTAKFEISVRRTSESAPELWRVGLFENMPDNPYKKMSEWHISKNTKNTELHKVIVERYLDDRDPKKIMFQWNGHKDTIITIEALSREQIRLSIFMLVIGVIIGLFMRFIHIEPFINIRM